MLHMHAIPAARIDESTVRGFPNRPHVVPAFKVKPDTLEHARESFAMFRDSAARTGNPCKVFAWWQGASAPRGLIAAMHSREFESAIGI